MKLDHKMPSLYGIIINKSQGDNAMESLKRTQYYIFSFCACQAPVKLCCRAILFFVVI
jgi:hypothetical protein